MGSGRFDKAAYSKTAATYATQQRTQIFKQKSLALL